MTLYNSLVFTALQNEDGSEKVFDPTTLVLIGAGSSSLFVAFVEYVYERKKSLHSKE